MRLFWIKLDYTFAHVAHSPRLERPGVGDGPRMVEEVAAFERIHVHVCQIERVLVLTDTHSR